MSTISLYGGGGGGDGQGTLDSAIGGPGSSYGHRVYGGTGSLLAAVNGGNGVDNTISIQYNPITETIEYVYKYLGAGSGGGGGASGYANLYDSNIGSNGGNGGWPGGAGGGGGAGVINAYGTVNGGNGGNGAAGCVYIEWW